MKITKYIKKTILLSLIFTLMSESICFASINGVINESVRFYNITIEDGLSQSTVEKIYQDSKGYMWLATNDGLDKYNGQQFKHYKHDKYNSNSISSNYIIDITEDNHGDMWISTSNGISRINTQTDEIKNYYEEEDKGNLSTNNICMILATKDGRIFAATEDGLNLYDKENDKFIRVLEKEDELPSQYIYSIKQDYKENIWIGTENGLVLVDKDLNILNKFENTIGSSDVYTTYEDLNGYMWVCTLRNGLFQIDLSKKDIVHYKHDENKNSILSDNVKDVEIDNNNTLWIATDEGLCNLDYRTEEFKSYKKKSSESDSILDDKIRCLFKDKSGLIWIGQYSGISIFNPNSSFEHYKANPLDENSLSGSLIYSIYKDKDNTLWLASDENGVDCITSEKIYNLNTENSTLLSNTIFDITGFNNYIFIGTNEGLSVVTKTDKNNHTINNYTKEDGLPSNKIRSLYLDSKNYLWIGTNAGIAILDPNTNKLENISYVFDKIGASDIFVKSVFEDFNGNYYIGCFLDGGLIKINPNTKEHKIYRNIENDKTSISNNTIRYIAEDKCGNILVGTNHGLNILNPMTDKFTHYTEADGLVNNTIYGILVDKNNNIWLSTNGGISKFSIKDKTFKNFTVKDGLQSNEFNGRACFQDKEGLLYFGGINGLNVIDVDNLQLSNFKPEVIFDSFEVNGVEEKDMFNRTFKYNQNNIKVKFFSNNYKDINNTKYYYRLSGVEDNWNLTYDNSLVFASLSPGKYKLELKTITNQGIESDINSISFTIKPHFMKSKIAILIYIILILILLYYQRQRVKILDKLVDKKTQELKKQMEKNETLYNKIIKLEQSKNNYIVNLSHELRTPLNILNSLNQLIKSFTDNDEELTKGKLSYYMDVMNRNCNRLLNLINNIIDYAKFENNTYFINKEPVDIVYLVEETVLDMKEYIEENKLELIFDTYIEEKIINCDRLDIERCIINLVNNAVKFTKPGGLIEVFIYDLDDKVKIIVRDNGKGISLEDQKYIFDRFKQVTDNESTHKKGSGLGLTITKQIISLHGGEINLNSKVNEGSEFIIILPVK